MFPIERMKCLALCFYCAFSSKHKASKGKQRYVSSLYYQYRTRKLLCNISVRHLLFICTQKLEIINSKEFWFPLLGLEIIFNMLYRMVELMSPVFIFIIILGSVCWLHWYSKALLWYYIWWVDPTANDLKVKVTIKCNAVLFMWQKPWLRNIGLPIYKNHH